MIAAVTVAAPKTSPNSTCRPPAAHAPPVGGIEIKTEARPPSATNPMIPTLNSPAKPHWRFTPRAIIAEIKPIFKMNSAVFQLWMKPVPAIKHATMTNILTFFTEGVILIFL
jgi:hypothetical protein